MRVCINNHKMEQTTASDNEEPSSSVTPAPKVHYEIDCLNKEYNSLIKKVRNKQCDAMSLRPS